MVQCGRLRAPAWKKRTPKKKRVGPKRPTLLTHRGSLCFSCLVRVLYGREAEPFQIFSTPSVWLSRWLRSRRWFVSRHSAGSVAYRLRCACSSYVVGQYYPPCTYYAIISSCFFCFFLAHGKLEIESKFCLCVGLMSSLMETQDVLNKFNWLVIGQYQWIF